MNTMIEVCNISKKYLLHHQKEKSNSLKEAFSGKIKSWFGDSPKDTIEEFWALENISFNVERGDRFGIIGQNGAGKSTLLKILSRIVKPTAGYINIFGRIASLLEVGTGFHPDLSGRENIYLNGTVLGMSEAEINRHFDEIVDFAGIEKFLDTPVKKYSSGMFARLGFSIAAHLDPDILIVDEVLSVGDMQFQEKCLNKLDSMSGEGKTILFVSHQMGAVLTLCNKGVYLKNGKVAYLGDMESCVNNYMQTVRNATSHWYGDSGDTTLRVKEFYVTSPRHHDYVRQGDPLEIHAVLEVLKPAPGLIFGFDLQNYHGHTLLSARTTDNPDFYQVLENAGTYPISFTLDTTHLRQGDYSIHAFAMIHNEHHIPIENVNIQLSVYPPANDVRFHHPHRCEGLFVGNAWKLNVTSGVSHG